MAIIEQHDGEVVVADTSVPIKDVIARINAGYTLKEIADLHVGLTERKLKLLMRRAFVVLQARCE